MAEYQFAVDKKDGKVSFIEVRNPEKDFSVTRNLLQGKGKESEYYQVGAFASVHGFDTDPKGTITRHVKAEWWPERFNDEDIHDAVNFLRTKYNELNSFEFRFAYDEFRAITYAIAMDGIEESPYDKFKDMGFTAGLQHYDKAVSIVKDALAKGIIKPKTNVTTFTHMDKDIDNALTFNYMEKTMKRIVMFKVGSQYRLSVRENGKEIDGMAINPLDEFDARKILAEKHSISTKPVMNLNYARDYDVVKAITLNMAQHGIENTPIDFVKKLSDINVAKYYQISKELVQETIDSGIKPRSYVLCQIMHQRVDKLFKCNEFVETKKPVEEQYRHIVAVRSYNGTNYLFGFHTVKDRDGFIEDVKKQDGYESHAVSINKEAPMHEKGPYYVAAAEYQKDEKGKVYEFALVHPTKGDPYVTLDPSGVKSTSHHSHVYELSDDLKTASLVTEHHVPGTQAPKQAKLSQLEYEGVQRSIKKLEADMTTEQKPKSYLAKPEGLPNFSKLSRTDREDMNIFANNFLDNFPKANLVELVKLSPIALQMTKYGVQNANGEIDTQRYDELTSKQKLEIEAILKPYPGIGLRLDYECMGAAIKLEMPNGRQINVPEFTARKLTVEKPLER